MAAVTAEFMRAVKLRQLYASSGQLKQANVLVNDLAHRPHIVSTLLLHQPDSFPFPLAYWQRADQSDQNGLRRHKVARHEVTITFAHD
jgi:hypothetical protein